MEIEKSLRKLSRKKKSRERKIRKINGFLMVCSVICLPLVGTGFTKGITGFLLLLCTLLIGFFMVKSSFKNLFNPFS